jgi:hypothetical protein
VDPLIHVITTSSIQSNRRFLDQSRSSRLCTQGRKRLGPGTWHGVGAVEPGRVSLSAGLAAPAGLAVPGGAAMPGSCGTLVPFPP